MARGITLGFAAASRAATTRAIASGPWPSTTWVYRSTMAKLAQPPRTWTSRGLPGQRCRAACRPASTLPGWREFRVDEVSSGALESHYILNKLTTVLGILPR
jgi:hypothetical protein